MVYFGYKNHIKVDAASKLITGYLVTNASKHHSQVPGELLNINKDKGQDLYGDSAYGGKEQLKIVAEKKMNSKVGEQGFKNNPLSNEQRASNKEKSRTRARVEHIFGFIEMSMNGMYVNVTGIKRVKGGGWVNEPHMEYV